MLIYYSTTFQNKTNVLYKNKIEITDGDEGTLRDLCGRFDYIPAQFKDGRRSMDNLISARTFAADVDNIGKDGKDLPESEWTTPEKVRDALPGVPFYAVTSRNSCKAKHGGNPPFPPRFHVLFPLAVEIDAPKQYGSLFDLLFRRLSALDEACRDVAHFYFASGEGCEVTFFSGGTELDLFLIRDYYESLPSGEFRADSQADSDDAAVPSNVARLPQQRGTVAQGEGIPQGKRNSTLSATAFILLKRYGESDGARNRYLEAVSRCSPPLEGEEVETIWRSAIHGYRKKVKIDPDYIPPDEFGRRLNERGAAYSWDGEAVPEQEDKKPSLIPSDFSDVGEARTFHKHYSGSYRFSRETSWLWFDGMAWVENSDLKARSAMQGLTGRQLDLAREMSKKAEDEILAAKAIEGDDGKAALEKAKQAKGFANSFYAFVLNQRKSSRIAAGLTEAQPVFEVDVESLDKDPFLLNTPGGAVDLKTGNVRSHDPWDYATKITKATPGDMGKRQFLDFLDVVTQGDRELAEFFQVAFGSALIGKVFEERLMVLVGQGGNGKSTLVNSISIVLGDYAGSISPDVFLASTMRNIMPEMATLRGRRLITAGEWDEGKRLDGAVVKRMVSTDPIHAEPKYRQPFDFKPSHHIFIHTNHIPKIGGVDRGIWDRIVIVPFRARLRGAKGEIKNYAFMLSDECGSFILQWLVDGAVRFVQDGYKFRLPNSVGGYTDEFRMDADWVTDFIESCCIRDPNAKELSSRLYEVYAAYSKDVKHDHIRNQNDFKTGLEGAGIQHKRMSAGVFFAGLKLREFQKVGDSFDFNTLPRV